MEKTKIGRSGAKLHKIEFGNGEDYIVVSVDDPILFDQFAAGFKKIIDLAEGIDQKISGIDEKYKGKEDTESAMNRAIEMSQENVRFSKEAVAIIDGIFGDGTMKKYFSNIYVELPDFLPDADCIMDFFDKINPVMESLFSKRLDEREKQRRQRMAKYQPEDHKKRGDKA